MSASKTIVVVAGVMLAIALLRVRAADAPAAPATQPSTQPARQTHTVKRGDLALEIDAEGLIQAADPLEIRIKPKVYQGPLTIAAVAQPGAMVKKGDLMLECDLTDIKWQLENTEAALATARAGLQKAEADSELGVKADALSLRIQEDAVKNAEASVKWWETMEGPQMLLSAELSLKQTRHFMEDQQDELNELKKMYKGEDITSSTAEIVVKRAVRQLDQAKIRLQMAEERTKKTTTFEYPIAQQRVLDAAEQTRQALGALKATQAQGAVARRGGLIAARIAYEQAQRRLNDLRNDFAAMSVQAPADGMVLYGQFLGGSWSGGDPRGFAIGENLPPGQVVMRLITPGKLKVELGLSEAQAFWIGSNAKATVKPAAFPLIAYEVQCPLPIAGPRGNPGAFGFQTTIPLANADPRLLPGMRASVHIDAGKVQNALLVPVAAVKEGKISIATTDGKTEDRAVTVGKSDGKMVEILSGLSGGEEVLIQGKK